jgi:hypothetical protein
MAGCFDDSRPSAVRALRQFAPFGSLRRLAVRAVLNYLPRPPRAREMMERDTAVAFDALAAMPNAFLRPSAGRPMPGFFTAAFASAAAAFAARLACRSARTLSAASSASVGVRVAFGVASGFLAIVPSVVVVA